MKTLTSVSDSVAIGLSSLCIIHCLAAPLLVVLLPSLTVIQFEDEIFHLGLLLAVVPISLISLGLGCKQHKRIGVLALGAIGIVVLVSALFVESLPNGETLEKVLTVAGALIVAFSHFLNFRYCRAQRDCDHAEVI